MKHLATFETKFKCFVSASTIYHFTFRDICLCKVCSEIREMWKKTGAWFYKSIPTYELPAKNPCLPTSASAEVSQKAVKTTKLGMELDDSESDEDRTGKTQEYLVRFFSFLIYYLEMICT